MKREDYIWQYGNPYDWMHKVRRSSFPSLIVCCAITGGVQGKEANENLPETPEEQAEQTYKAYQAGASVVHIHARSPQKWYACTGNTEQYRLIHSLIREKCPDIIINDTSGGSAGMPIKEKLGCLDAEPDVATLNMGPEMFSMTLKERMAPLPSPRSGVRLEGCEGATYAGIADFARAMKEHGVKPEMELYNPGMFWVVDHLISNDLVKAPYLIQFVMGTQTGSYPTPANLIALVNELPDQAVWSVAGIGPFQLSMNVMSIVLGGHVRVGLEDNVYYKRGQLLKSNAEAVERIVRIARDMNRDIATPAQAREMLGLPQK